MPPPENEPKTLEANVTQDRLKAWKERRAKVAQTSRDQRLRQAETDRRARIRQAEEDRDTRAREAAERRARQIAQERADRLEAARAKLVGRAEIDAARERLVHYRARSARAFARRVAAFILLPTALVAAYLFAVATPLYEAEAVVAVRAPAVPDAQRPIFALPAGTEAAHQVRAVMRADPTLRAVDAEHGLTAHFASTQMDPLRRLHDLSALQISSQDQLRRFVSVDVRAFEGLVTLSVLARSPAKAEDLAAAILARTEIELDARAGTDAPILATIVEPNASEIATSPGRLSGTVLAFVCFVALFAAASILLSTLRRHAWT